MKVKADIVTSDDIKINDTGKFQDFTASYIINFIHSQFSSMLGPDMFVDSRCFQIWTCLDFVLWEKVIKPPENVTLEEEYKSSCLLDNLIEGAGPLSVSLS